MLDVGEKAFLKCNPQYIFITHLHADHAFFVATSEKIDTDIPVFALERSERLKSMAVVSDPIELGSYRITPIPVTHSIKGKSVGYLVEKENVRIFYTGDIVSIKEKYSKVLRKLDVVIAEASFLRKED